MTGTRKLAAILVADVVGYSRLAGADEERTLARLQGPAQRSIDPAIAAHHGRIVKGAGDGLIIDCRSAVDAVRCAIEVQTGLIERNARVPELTPAPFNSSTLNPACRMMDRSVPGLRSRDESTGTVTVRVALPGKTIT